MLAQGQLGAGGAGVPLGCVVVSTSFFTHEMFRCRSVGCRTGQTSPGWGWGRPYTERSPWAGSEVNTHADIRAKRKALERGTARECGPLFRRVRGLRQQRALGGPSLGECWRNSVRHSPVPISFDMDRGWGGTCRTRREKGLLATPRLQRTGSHSVSPRE